MDDIENDYLRNYEKIRCVGKGAFGIAFLYKKRTDEKLVVIKEINMIETSAAERQMALNEVQILSVLNHQNIVSYFRSFEIDGILMIEMEYAEGGTLAQYLKNRTEILEEFEIIQMFQQIVSAVRYIHDHNILHRDLKTANIFLTGEKMIKVGDFGISKIMSTKAQAETVLGTPYYMSPEMCEGKLYDEKSDIWALGCILYDMACLQKPFEGTNLLVLVNKITKGHFQLPTGFSESFLNLLLEMLNKDPSQRPTAETIENERIPILIENFLKNTNDNYSSVENEFGNKSQTKRSVLYKMEKLKTNFSLIPIQTPPKAQIIQLATSETHCIALTSDLVVLSWGNNYKGQLGHGDRNSRKKPTEVEALRGKNIKIIGAGDGFSVFVTETGMVMTCGNGRNGSLGHGDRNDLHKPKLLEKLLSEDIVAIDCGDHHVAAISKEAVVYSWGQNQFGCLGLGDKEDRCSPFPVKIPKQFIPKIIRCGCNCTVVVGIDGLLLACGDNKYNKLGLEDSMFSFWPNFKSHTKEFLTLQRVKNIKMKVMDVALGPTHSVFLTENGQVLTMGSNFKYQLGRKVGLIPYQQPIVQSLACETVTMIQCGPTFSLASTSNNILWFWGKKYKKRPEKDGFVKNTLQWFDDCEEVETAKEPTEILGLYASPQQMDKKASVQFSGIHTYRGDILLLVETSVPLMRKSNNPEKFFKETDSKENLEEIPGWIKTEFAECVTPSTEFNSVFTID